MRIGIFTDTYPPYINGVSTSILMLERALEKKGHQVFIVTVNADDYSYKYENEDKIIRIPGIPIGIYDYRLTGVYPLRVIDKIKKWNLDIIHSHTEFGVGTFARIIAKQLDIPLVHTYHTMYEDYVHYITKGYFDGTSKKIVEYLTKFYCDKTATELIVPTKKTYDLFKEKYKVDRNVHIVPTGIEVERFYREKYNKLDISDLKRNVGLDEDDKVILFVGRLGKEKCVDVLLEGHKNIIKQEPKCKLVIIGDGPDSDHFKEITKKLKIEDNVIFVGRVPWEDIPKYYQFADIFATASNTETQGLTVIEAMAASIPVVCLDDDAFRLVVVDGVNGRLFKNKKQYAKIVCELFSNPEITKEMSRKARSSAEKHSSEFFADKVLNVYKIAMGITNDVNVPKKKNFFTKMKNVIKKGFNG